MQGAGVQRKTYPYSRIKLFLSTFTGFSLLTAVGLFMGWSSPGLVLLKPRKFTSLQNTLLASIGGLAPGPLITIFGIDLIGRKRTLLVIWSLIMVSWAMMIISEDVYVLLSARFIGGWGMGATFSVVGIYTSEIADVAVRGPLNSMSLIFFSLGKTIISSVGPFTTIKILAIVAFTVSLVFIIFYWVIPESPYYLVSKGQNDKALSALLWLRQNAQRENVEDELSKIQYSIEEEKKTKVGLRKIFSSRAVWKQFGVAWYILYLQQISGFGPLTAYAQLIFEAAQIKFDAAYVPIGLHTVAMFAGLPTPFLVKRFGNKRLFIFSTFGCALGSGLISLYFFLLNGGSDVSGITWLPIGSTFFLLFVVYSGFGGVIWAVVADLFAPSVKATATGVCGIFSTFLGFVSVTVFGLVKDNYGFGPAFLGYSVLLVISSFGLIYVPNMTHMTLQEIQDMFEGKDNSSEKMGTQP